MRVLMTKGRHEGRVIDHPLHVARKMLDAGIARRVNLDARTTDIEREYARTPEPETPEATDLAGMSKAELVAEAEARGIEVTREDGEGGTPLKSDYVRALGG